VSENQRQRETFTMIKDIRHNVV